MEENWPDSAEPVAEEAEAAAVGVAAEAAVMAAAAKANEAVAAAAAAKASAVAAAVAAADAAAAATKAKDAAADAEIKAADAAVVAALAETAVAEAAKAAVAPKAGMAEMEEPAEYDEEGEPHGSQVEDLVNAILLFDDRGEYIYVMGGDVSREYSGSVVRYIIEEDKWEHVEGAMPHSGSGSAVLVWGRHIWVIGGEHDAENARAQVYRYDYQENNWYYESAMLHARAFFGAVLVDSSIYVIGGRHKITFLNSIEKYSLEHGWEECPPMKIRRCSFGCYSVQRDIFVLGGMTHEFEAELSIERFDTLTMQWSFHIHSLLRNRTSFDVAVVGDVAFAIGGDDGNTVASFHVNNPNDISCVNGMLIPRIYFSSVVTTSGLVYVIGGKLRSNFSLSEAIECFNPVTKLWKRLRDMPRSRGGGAVLVLDPAIHGPL